MTELLLRNSIIDMYTYMYNIIMCHMPVPESVTDQRLREAVKMQLQ